MLEDTYLLNLIKEGKTLNAISRELNLTNQQLHHRLVALRQSGLRLYERYDDKGNITYGIDKTIDGKHINKKPGIKLSSSTTELKVMVVSDLHLGCEKENLQAIDKIMDYNIRKDIRLVLNTGDFVDGFFGQHKKHHETHEEQIEYALRRYPSDDNILNFLVLGNHDIQSLKQTGIDLAAVMQNERFDMIPLGYEEAELSIGDDSIIMHHRIESAYKSDFNKDKLALIGHTHQMKHSKNQNAVYVPSLSDIHKTDYLTVPGVVLLNFTIYKGQLEKVYIDHLVVDKKVFSVRLTDIDLANTAKTIQSMDFENRKVNTKTKMKKYNNGNRRASNH